MLLPEPACHTEHYLFNENTHRQQVQCWRFDSAEDVEKCICSSRCRPSLYYWSLWRRCRSSVDLENVRLDLWTAHLDLGSRYWNEGLNDIWTPPSDHLSSSQRSFLWGPLCWSNRVKQHHCLVSRPLWHLDRKHKVNVIITIQTSDQITYVYKCSSTSQAAGWQNLTLSKEIFTMLDNLQPFFTLWLLTQRVYTLETSAYYHTHHY